jgi:hypothetical protein
LHFRAVTLETIGYVMVVFFVFAPPPHPRVKSMPKMNPEPNIAEMSFFAVMVSQSPVYEPELPI